MSHLITKTTVAIILLIETIVLFGYSTGWWYFGASLGIIFLILGLIATILLFIKL